MGNWIVDHVHSTVGFEVKHMMIAKVRGQFDSFTAEVEAEEIMDLTTANISFQIEADSINTRILERDKHLRSADFFDVNNYPIINFQSTNIIKIGDDYQITGDLTIKDITKPVTFAVAFGGKAMDLRGVEVFGFEAEAMINREEFGLRWNAALETGGVLAGKEVRIIVELELHKATSNEVLSSNDEKPMKKEATREEFYKMIAENLPDLVTVINLEGDILYVNPSLQRIVNDIDYHSLNKMNFYELIHPKEVATIREEILLNSSRTIKKVLQNEFRFLQQEGHYMEVEATITSMCKNPTAYSEDEFILVVMRDISERKETEKAIYHLAFHDSLTNLPNRRSFMNQLRNVVLQQKYNKSKFSVFFLDMDNFKQINDQYGHEIGDKVLIESANRIRSAIRPFDLAARFGGDEFVIMLKDVEREEDSLKIAKRILKQFHNPITIDGQEYSLTTSIGIAHYPIHGDSPEELIKNADTALYYVKERGKSDLTEFNQQMENQSLEHRILENALRQGIKAKQFFLEYQPKINIESNELIGMEALVRWKHPELGIISPGKFIPLAEETGLIVPLGEWILRESIHQTKQWNNDGYPSLNISVNVSVRQLEDIHFVDKVKTILDESGLNPDQLEFEITESVLADIKNTVPILKEIRELGIQISIDDFGTGYSSLNYIKELPINTLKIDQTFIKDIHMNRESKEIAKAILNLADSIGLHVVAEGIELKEHIDALKKGGCVLGQGYYFSKPLNVDEFEQYLLSSYQVS